MKVPVVTNFNYVMYFEFFEGNNVFHCDVNKWNKSIKKSLIDDFNTLCSIYRKNIFCFMQPNNTKLRKFANMLGFVKFQDFIGTDGVEYTLFIRRT